MDPALRELISGEGAEEVEAIVRLHHPDTVPEGLQLVATFGNIATCRLRRDKIRDVWSDEAVASLKAPRLIDPDIEIVSAGVEETPGETVSYSDSRRSESQKATGRGVVVGVVDWGCDFVHPNFLNPDGTTRLLALWNQSAEKTDKSPAPYGYGSVHQRDDINRALRDPRPYEYLHYHPAHSDFGGSGSHGTHVLDIAAGNGRLPGSPLGIAPEADIVFVQLATRSISGLANLGDSVRILEAIDFISKTAGSKPAVINLSVGRTGGPHTGDTLVEQGMDAFLKLNPGRAIVQSTGNYFNTNTHTAGQLYPGHTRALTWTTDKADITPNEMEIWYPGTDTLAVEMLSPGGQERFRTPLGEKQSIQIHGREVGRIYHRKHDPNNGENHIDIFLYKTAPAGQWKILLKGEDIVDGRFHAWVERDSGCRSCQSRFKPEEAVPTCTIGTIANGFQTITVGAYDPHSPHMELAPFSSSGPTADGRQKPNLVAPGVNIMAARSTPKNMREGLVLLTRKSGTSMAAPHVTGTAALIFEAAQRPLQISETRKLLIANTRKNITAIEDDARIGNGYLDIDKAVEAAFKWAEQGDTNKIQKGVTMDNNRESIDIEEKKLNEEMFSEEPEEEDNDVLDEELYPGIESADTRLIELADEAVSEGERLTAPGALLHRVLPKIGVEESLNPIDKTGDRFISPAVIFDVFSQESSPGLRDHFEKFFQVVALPGQPLREDLQPGDILIRRALGENNTGHLAMIADGEARPPGELTSVGIQPESFSEGRYVQVVETGPFPHGSRDQFARKITEEDGRISPYNLLLRFHPEIGIPLSIIQSIPSIRLRRCRKRQYGYYWYGGGRLDKKLAGMKRRKKLTISAREIDILQRVANVETGGYVHAVSNCDDAVISFGFMQWTLRYNELQDLIKRVPAAFKRYGIERDTTKSYTFTRSTTATAIKGAPRYNDLRKPQWVMKFCRAALDEKMGEDIIAAEVAKALETLKKLEQRIFRYWNGLFSGSNWGTQNPRLVVWGHLFSTVSMALLLEVENNRPAYLRGILKQTFYNTRFKWMQQQRRNKIFTYDMFLDGLCYAIRQGYKARGELATANGIIKRIRY